MKQSKPLSKISAVIASILSASNALPSYSQENSDGFALEEVVVTARRVEESLQNSPVAITAITGSMLCLLYTSPSPRDMWTSRMPSSA